MYKRDRLLPYKMNKPWCIVFYRTTPNEDFYYNFCIYVTLGGLQYVHHTVVLFRTLKFCDWKWVLVKLAELVEIEIKSFVEN